MEKLFNIIRATHSTFSGVVPVNLRLTIAAMGITGEGAELMDHIKKNIEQLRPVDTKKVCDELADVLYYVGLACLATGQDFDDLVNRLDTKLKKRYPKGFNAVDAVLRIDVE